MIAYCVRIFFRYHWLGAIVISFVIFLLSSTASLQKPPVNIPFLDKFAHVCLYFVLGFCYLCGFTRGFIANNPRRFVLAFFAASFFGALDEYHQSFVPGRFPEFLDWLADLVGLVFIFILCFYVLKKKSY